MTAHKHAQLMALYAKDAAETDRPWERWECRSRTVNWISMVAHPSWGLDSEFRRKPDPAQRFIPVLRMPAGSLVLTEAKTDRKYAIDDRYSGRKHGEKQVGVLHVQLHPETLKLISAEMEVLK